MARPSFFADMVQPSAFENISRAISRGVLSAKPASRAGGDIQGDAMLLADLLYFADVGHRHRLAAAGVVGDREHHERDFLGALAISASDRRTFPNPVGEVLPTFSYECAFRSLRDAAA